MKVVVAINTLTSLDNFVYSNHASFYYRMGKMLPRQDDVILFHPFRMSIDRMRNEACRVAMENDAEYIFFIDDDVQIPYDAFFQLRRHDKDVVAGVTYIRGYPFHPMIFKFREGNSEHYVDDYKEHICDGLVECDAVGFSCCLIKTSLVRKMSTPYALTGSEHTEDIYFCAKAKAEVPDVGIYVDPNVQTAHKFSSEFIEDHNRKAFKAYCETMGMKDTKATGRVDRSEEYLHENGITIKDLESRMWVAQD